MKSYTWLHPEYRQLLQEAERALKKSLRKDYYKILGLTKDCNDADIKKAYRKLALQYHPDKNAGDDKAEARFKEIGEAYAILSDPGKRQRFDSGADLDGSADFMDVNDIFSQYFGGGAAEFGGHSHGHGHGHSHGFSGGPFGGGGFPSGFPAGGFTAGGFAAGGFPAGGFSGGGFPGTGARSTGRGGPSTSGFGERSYNVG